LWCLIVAHNMFDVCFRYRQDNVLPKLSR
jgi:hypothetical protein